MKLTQIGRSEEVHFQRAAYVLSVVKRRTRDLVAIDACGSWTTYRLMSCYGMWGARGGIER